MPTLKLHYDGWIALPAGLRQALGLSSGDRLDAELVDGALVLRPATKARAGRAVAQTAGATKPAEMAPDTLPVINEPATTAKFSRSAKGATHDDVAESRKRRGRPAKAEVAAQPSAPTHPIVGIGPAKLVKKAELAVKAVHQEGPPAPAARIRPERASQAVERRPFRNVEVRTLGPGRGHNRSRRMPSGSAV
jgi:AbrB family looped-hinge helix DNA binding protein